MSRDKILHDSWSISAALARGFSDRHFERGEGPGDDVEFQVLNLCSIRRVTYSDVFLRLIHRGGRCDPPPRSGYQGPRHYQGSQGGGFREEHCGGSRGVPLGNDFVVDSLQAWKLGSGTSDRCDSVFLLILVFLFKK